MAHLSLDGDTSSTYLPALRHPSSFVMENCKLNWLRHMPNGLFVSFFRSISQMSTPIFYNITLQRYGVSSHKTIGKYIFLRNVAYDIKLIFKYVVVSYKKGKENLESKFFFTFHSSKQ